MYTYRRPKTHKVKLILAVLVLLLVLPWTIWVNTAVRFGHTDWTETQLFLFWVTAGKVVP